jgi:hypothetical protein
MHTTHLKLMGGFFTCLQTLDRKCIIVNINNNQTVDVSVYHVPKITFPIVLGLEKKSVCSSHLAKCTQPNMDYNYATELYI